MTQHPDYGTLGARIFVSNLHKNTTPKFSVAMRTLQSRTLPDGTPSPILSPDVWKVIRNNIKHLDAMIVDDRDYVFDYFGLKTLEKQYLQKVDGRIVERPQYMWLRVALEIHRDNLTLVKETYDLMSQKYFTHASPTLFNAGTNVPQLSSCFLVGIESDSINGIYNTLGECAAISKYSGGIGIHATNIRPKGSPVYGTNGVADGMVPMLRVFNSTARYVKQSQRPGSFAIYLEPWHPDILDFLEMKKNHGDEELKARDLFYAMWIPDLFMKRVKEDHSTWSLFCPNKCPGLNNVYGEEFEKLYLKYEQEGKAMKTVSPRDIWFKILDSQMETGTPYLLYKDAANQKSNQQNIGTIKSSNLCTEIIEYSDENETAVCNLASIGLPTFVDKVTKTFNYDELHRVTKIITHNLDTVIDRNYYPTPKAKLSNMRHRPIGIGVQGLADVYFLLGIPFHSDHAKDVNKLIFETIYHAAIERSMEISKERSALIHNHPSETKSDTKTRNLLIGEEELKKFGNDLTKSFVGAYSSFVGSPASNGNLQFDMWGVDPTDKRYNWSEMKQNIVEHGIRNSLLVAPMPTASTSQILGFNECFEPITSNIYSRRTIAGEFVVPNKYMMHDLLDMNLWNETIKNSIVANRGSVQHLTEVSQEFKDKYKIVWEMPMKHLIDMSADRGAFICQSQSLNLWMEDPVYSKLTSMHFYAWSKGLKTGIYYLRRKAKHQAQQFTIEPKKIEKEEEPICEMCSA